MLAPRERQPLTGPGTAPTGRPQSTAISAVINEPERSAASTTIVISARAAISLLRAGNIQRKVPLSGGSSLSTRPSVVISR